MGVTKPVSSFCDFHNFSEHYNDVIIGMISSQITSLTIVFSTVYLDTDQRKHQSSPSLAFVRAIHRRPVNSLHKWPVMRKMFPFDDVIMIIKMLVILWISHSYLTDVTTAELWLLLLSYINVIERICRYFYKIKNCPNREINKQSFCSPHASIGSENNTNATLFFRTGNQIYCASII